MSIKIIRNVKQSLFFLTLTIVMLLSFAGCGKSKYRAIKGLNTEEEVTIRIAIPTKTDVALNSLCNDFMKKYPNVTINLQYVENYTKNAETLFRNNEIDFFLQRGKNYAESKNTDEVTGETTVSSSEDFYYNFYQDPDIDFSGTNPLLMGNYTHNRQDENGNEVTYLYSVPLGGETRGFFVNKAFLKSRNMEIPKNYTEFLDCCSKLLEAGFIPIQGNPSSASYAIGLPQIAREVVNDEEGYELLKSSGEGVSELFRDTMEKIYEITTKGYYEYKKMEEQGLYTTVTEEGLAMNFLGLTIDDDFVVSKPENNIGTGAFFPYISSAGSVFRSLIKEYSLDSDIEFILTPLNDASENSSAYVTLYYGLCANKNSENLEWLREFVNFACFPENNEKYAKEAGIISNTKDAIKALAKQYGINETDCIFCGRILFRDDYNAYTPISKGLISICKLNAGKYMVKLEKDENNQIVFKKDSEGREYLPLNNEKLGTEKETMIYREFVGEESERNPGLAYCTLEYYMDLMESNFEQYRSK